MGRSPAELDMDQAAADAVRRSTRLLGAVKPRSAHLTVVFDPGSQRPCCRSSAGTLDGEAVLKGRSLFAERVGEEVAVGGFTLVDDPTDPDAYGAAAYRRRGPGHPAQRADRGRRPAPFLYNTYSARRAGTVSTGSAVRAGFKSAPRSREPGPCRCVPGTRRRRRSCASVGDGLLVQSVTGIHSGVNPVSGDFSVGAEGMLIKGGELAGPVREFTIASTIQRMLSGVVAIGQRPRAAAVVGRRRDPGHRRHRP